MQLAFFSIIVAMLAWLCRHQLGNPRCHGFYRFYAFVGIAWLLSRNLPHWHDDLGSPRQWLSLALLLGALGFLASGLHQLKVRGGHRDTDRPRENFRFENTRQLVICGIYSHIRHPMYTSLLFLGWGILLKQINVSGLAVVALVTAALYLAARFEERENLAFFGPAYADYQKSSKMFVPFLL